jgi:hypothetical protein
MNKYEIWTEGYSATGESGKAFRINKEGEENTLWEAPTFPNACANAISSLNWDMNLYNPQRNTYWACKFYDNEKDARKSFG